jgi:hypothetical protein
MSTPRRIALWSGLVFLFIGTFGLIFARSGNFLGLFPVNVLLEIVYIMTGLWLLYASTDDAATHTAGAILGPIYGVLGVVGLIWPAWGVFGLLPLYGLNVVLFIVFGLLMAYDWLTTPTTPRRNTTA